MQPATATQGAALSLAVPSSLIYVPVSLHLVTGIFSQKTMTFPKNCHMV